MNEVIRKKEKNQKNVSSLKKTKSVIGSISPELHKLISGLGQIAEQAYQAYSPIVEDIVNRKSHDTQEIEHTLDGLLGFCFDDKMLVLFKKLCRYYYFIDPVAAADHVYAYRDMWDEKSLSDEKVKKGMSKLANSSDTVGRIRAKGLKATSEVSTTRPASISKTEREQLKKLKNSPKKLMSDE